VALPLDEAALPKTGEMPRDVRLGQPRRGDEIADALLSSSSRRTESRLWSPSPWKRTARSCVSAIGSDRTEI
jgi:hypothetical protein